MGAESRLLYDERPLVLIPELARLLKGVPGFNGIDEALVLQQVHYWVILNQRAGRNEQDGFFWTYNTFAAWSEQFANLWSVSTLKRIFARLEKAGFLVKGRFNKSNIDRTKWYRVNHERLSLLCQIDPSVSVNMDLPLGQLDPLHSVNPTLTDQAQATHENPLPESNQKQTSESNNREEQGASSKAPRANVKRDYSVFFEGMQVFFNYPTLTDKDPIPNHGKEAKAIARMLQRGYSEGDIMDAWKAKCSSRGVNGKPVFVSMVYVNEDIGKPTRPIFGRQASLLPTEGDLVAQAKERGLN